MKVAVQNVLFDCKFAARLWRRRPIFNLAVSLILALGLAATATVFIVVNRVLLNPIPGKDADRVLFVGAPSPSAIGDGLAFWGTCPCFSSIALYRSGGTNAATLDWAGRAATAIVSSRFFSVFEIRPQLGRELSTGDEVPGNHQVAVISDLFWTRIFSRSPEVLGQTIKLNGVPHTIVAVLPSGFSFPGHTQIWVPKSTGASELRLGSDEQEDIPAIQRSGMLGRLPEGVNVAEARNQMRTLFDHLHATFGRPGVSFGSGVQLVPLRERITRRYKDSFVTLAVAVIALLLIACINAGTLLVGKSLDRKSEIAIRYCLGAQPRRIVRQILIEGLVAAAITFIIAGGITYLLVALVRTLGPANVPGLSDISVDGVAVFWLLAATVLVNVLSGVWPIWTRLRTDPGQHINAIGSTNSSRSGLSRQSRYTLAIVQVALALVLFLVATLTARSYARLGEIPLGFQTDNVLSMHLAFSPNNSHDSDRIAVRFQQILDSVAAIPRVSAVGAVTDLPLAGTGGGKLYLRDQEQTLGDAFVFWATDGYFASMGITLRAGRFFTSKDSRGTRPVMIVSETLAARYLGGKQPIGHELLIDGEELPREIVGIVADVKNASIDEDARPQMYIPMFQGYRNSHLPLETVLTIRASTDAYSVLPSVRSKLRSLEPELSIYRTKSIENIVDQSAALPKFRTFLMVFLAFFSGLLAVFGVYGVVAYSVSSRTREIGIRMSLGAQRRDIFLMVIREAALLGLTGTMVGAFTSLGVGRFLPKILFAVDPADTSTLVYSVLVLFGVSVLASVIPALHAIRIQPAVALRHV